jgi:tetratricopeptide (TPR) repeat protein
VEGLPLALELAAVRVKLLSPEALLARMERRLPILSGGSRDAPDRQRTMRDTIAWSHDLLSVQEQTLFRRLAVFAGGFTVEAAEVVASAGTGSPGAAGTVLEGLASLLDQSLLRPQEPAARGGTGEARFAMLETVREYALERLGMSGEEEVVQRAHAVFCLALVEEAQGRIHGPDGPATLDRLEAEDDNLRAALAWAIAQGETDIALRLANGCWRFWWMHSHLEQGRLWLEQALTLPGPEAAGSAVRPLVLVAAGYFARIQGDFVRAMALGEEALTAARAIGDFYAMGSALFSLGLVALDQGELERARAHHQAALRLHRETGYDHGMALQLTRLGDIAVAQGNPGEAETLGEAALAIWRDRGDAWGIAWALMQLGSVARAQGDDARAIALFRQSLASNARLGDKEIIARVVAELAAIACDRGQFLLAARLYGGVAALRETLGAPLAPAEWARYDRALAATRSELAEGAFHTAWDAGRVLPLERIIAEAESLEGN